MYLVISEARTISKHRCKSLECHLYAELGHVQIPTVAHCLERGKASEGYKSSGPSVNSVVYWSSLVFEGVRNFASSFERGNPIMKVSSAVVLLVLVEMSGAFGHAVRGVEYGFNSHATFWKKPIEGSESGGYLTSKYRNYIGE